MRSAYLRLHELGHAHAMETWRGPELVGGLYGIALGGVFFGESMFSRATDASKVALVQLVRLAENRGMKLIDCQVATGHLASLGSQLMPRAEFLRHVQDADLRRRPDRHLAGNAGPNVRARREPGPAPAPLHG